MGSLTSELILFLAIALIIAAVCIIPAARKKTGSSNGSHEKDVNATSGTSPDSHKPVKRNENKE